MTSVPYSTPSGIPATPPSPAVPTESVVERTGLSPVRQLMVILIVLVSCFGMAFALSGLVSPLPAPAAGGTCGPTTASEAAWQALADPHSIGAGPEPQAGTAAHAQWKAFVDQCQSMADRRGLATMAIFVISVAVGAAGLIVVLRRPRSRTEDAPSDSQDSPHTGVNYTNDSWSTSTQEPPSTQGPTDPAYPASDLSTTKSTSAVAVPLPANLNPDATVVTPPLEPGGLKGDD